MPARFVNGKMASISLRFPAAPDVASSLGRTTTSAPTIGSPGSTLIAMTTRATYGHGGGAHAADDFAWLPQASVQLRLPATLWPAAFALAIAFAAVAWAHCALAWTPRLARWSGTPGIDAGPADGDDAASSVYRRHCCQPANGENHE